jgi:hypothetical protein
MLPARRSIVHHRQVKLPVLNLLLLPTGRCSFPMTFGLLASSIIKHIRGAAVTPLIIADQTSALMGSSLVKLIKRPINVATASTP